MLPETGEKDGEHREYLQTPDHHEDGEEYLGKVSDILETGANLVLRIQDGKKSFLLPFVDAFLIDVDIEQKKITIKEMEGLR